MASTVHAWLRALAAPLLMGATLAQATADEAPPAAFVPEKNLCVARAEAVAIGSAQWNGWGRDLDNTRYQPEPAIRATDVPKLGLKWSFGAQNSTQFGQPTVVDGRLFIASSAGRVYALDAKSGCSYWTFDAAAGSRTAVSIGELGQSKRAVLPKKLKRTLAHLEVIKAPSAAFFGDDSGNVYALDAQNGKLLWKTRADAHPLARIVGAPTLYNDKLLVTVGSTEQSASANPGYSCCTFRGAILALDIASGRILWKSYTVLEEPRATRKSAAGVQEFGPAGAAIYASPTIDPKLNVLYVTTGGSPAGAEQSSLTNAVAAFDLNDGKLRWVKQLTLQGEVAASGFSSSPILRTLSTGNRVLLAGQGSGVIYGLDPEHGGNILWQTRVNLPGAPGAEQAAPRDVSAGGILWGMAADHRNLYVGLADQLSQPANPAGSLFALDMKSGLIRWSTPTPQPACSWGENCWHGQAQAVTVMPGSVFAGSMDGHLRAYSTIDGKILWDFDTAKAYQTQNGVHAAGAALDSGGATIVNGCVYINSGNSLLAFSVDGK